jgi:DNA repair exonuclease SbcCD ATPase subunit
VGAVNFSLDIKLVEELKQVLPLSIFVETGTFEGETVNQVHHLFDEIYTVELADEYYQKASRRFEANASIKVFQASSDSFLKDLSDSLRDKSVLYWLDAHWCVAEGTAGQESQCPLLEELAAIESLNSESVILIDDARLFLCTPPRPHRVGDWPNFDSIIKKLFSLSSNHQVMVVNDVIAYYPKTINQTLEQYAYENSIDWLYVLNQFRHTDSLLLELQRKEATIQEKETAIQEKEAVIQEKEAAIQEKQKVIEDLFTTAEDRLRVIQEQKDALERLRLQKKEALERLIKNNRMRRQTIKKQAKEIVQLRQELASTWDKRIENKLSKLFGQQH